MPLIRRSPRLNRNVSVDPVQGVNSPAKSGEVGVTEEELSQQDESDNSKRDDPSDESTESQHLQYDCITGEELDETSAGGGTAVGEPALNLNPEENGEAQRAGGMNKTMKSVYMSELRDVNRFKLRRGYAGRITDYQGIVHIKYHVKTATTCPCEDRNCKVLVRLGHWGALGRGKWHCVHCGHFITSVDTDGVTFATAFRSASHLKKHLRSRNCRKSRDLQPLSDPPRSKLGPMVAHSVNNPNFGIVENGRKKFKCPACYKTVAYPNRYEHVCLCFPKHGRPLT